MTKTALILPSSGPLLEYRGLIPPKGEVLQPMTPKQSSMFVAMLTAELSSTDDLWKALTNESSVVSVASVLIEKRLSKVGLSSHVDSRLKCFLGLMSETPAIGVLWAYTLACMVCAEQSKVTFDTFSSMKYFGNGLPTSEFIEKQWEAQKRDSGEDLNDNSVDSSEYWPHQ
jgi:hypothetical protein